MEITGPNAVVHCHKNALNVSRANLGGAKIIGKK